MAAQPPLDHGVPTDGGAEHLRVVEEVHRWLKVLWGHPQPVRAFAQTEE